MKSPIKRVAVGLIHFYQKKISPLFPANCRFYPTCSQYAVEAIERFGFLRGGMLAVKRILRCNPLYKGKWYDPVPVKNKQEKRK